MSEPWHRPPIHIGGGTTILPFDNDGSSPFLADSRNVLFTTRQSRNYRQPPLVLASLDNFGKVFNVDSKLLPP